MTQKTYGIVGWKNAGKTTLTERLVAEFTRRGVRISTVKHAHHAVDVDHPGKDSHRHRAAGAAQVMLASANRWALMQELRGAEEPPLAELLAKMAPVDLILIEGFKRDDHPKIEVRRGAPDHPVLAQTDPNVRAIATLGAWDVPCDVPRLDLDDVAAIADFIAKDIDL